MQLKVGIWINKEFLILLIKHALRAYLIVFIRKHWYQRMINLKRDLKHAMMSNSKLIYIYLHENKLSLFAILKQNVVFQTIIAKVSNISSLFDEQI